MTAPVLVCPAGAPYLPGLRRPGVRVHLPAHPTQNLTALRVLASLGVDVAADLDGGTPDWDARADLAAHALLGLVPRGSIEPIESLARDHGPAVRTALVVSAFDDPARFVHADGSGRLALSARELAEGRLVAEELSALDGLEALPAYRERLEAWRSAVLTLNACSTCPGWRLCGGVLGGRDAAEPACRSFASELLELVEQRAALPRGGRAA